MIFFPPSFYHTTEMTHVLLMAFVVCVGRGKSGYLLNHFRARKITLKESLGGLLYSAVQARYDVTAYYSTLTAQLPLMMLLMMT